MKLVIQWEETDNYTYSCNHLMCVEYDSIENFYFDLVAQVDNYIKQLEIYNKESDVYWEQSRKYCARLTKCVDHKKKLKLTEEIEKWQNSHARPNAPKSIFKLNDFEFNCQNFVKVENGKPELITPKIYTVDEWFTTHLGQVI